MSRMPRGPAPWDAAKMRDVARRVQGYIVENRRVTVVVKPSRESIRSGEDRSHYTVVIEARGGRLRYSCTCRDYESTASLAEKYLGNREWVSCKHIHQALVSREVVEELFKGDAEVARFTMLYLKALQAHGFELLARSIEMMVEVKRAGWNEAGEVLKLKRLASRFYTRARRLRIYKSYYTQYKNIYIDRGLPVISE